MRQFFRTMAIRHNRYMTYLGRRRACDVLLKNSDRMLEDAGFSRALLERGPSAWPWLANDDETLPALQLDTMATQNAIEELQAYSDKELHDIGITRGAIKDAVLHGRPGIDEELQRQAA